VAVGASGYFLVTQPDAPASASKPTGTAASPAQREIRSEGTTPQRQQRTQTAATAKGFGGFHWGMVEADDYKEFIENLRGIGCPEETIKDIIIADVNKLYASRLAAV